MAKSTFVDDYLRELADHSSEEFFEHHGIKGMKWGVRRTDAQLRAARGKSDDEDNRSADANTKRSTRVKGSTLGTSSLSNKEMQDYINRVRLEQEYRKITTPQKSSGRKYIEKLLKDVGDNELRGLLKGKPGPIATLIVGGNTKGSKKGKTKKAKSTQTSTPSSGGSSPLTGIVINR